VLAVLVCKCLHETGPAYQADIFSHSSDFESRRRLSSKSSLNWIVRRTYGDCALSAAGPRLWNSLPRHVTSRHVTSVSLFIIFKTRLKTFIFSRCFLNYSHYYYYYYYYMLLHLSTECNDCRSRIPELVSNISSDNNIKNVSLVI